MVVVDDQDALRDALIDLVQVNSRLVQAIRRIARASGAGDALAAWRTLGVLQRSGPVRLGVLAETSQVAQPTMTKLVTGLVDRGWAQRLPDADDARAWLIAITADGLAALGEWRANLATVLMPHFAGIDAAELEALRGTVALLESRVAAMEPTTYKTEQQEVAL